MKIQKNDLTDCRSLTFRLLQEMTDYSRDLREKADRMEDLNYALVSYIRDGIIDDTEIIKMARAWYDHSELSSTEIMNKILR